jgi:hypothetical protein
VIFLGGNTTINNRKRRGDFLSRASRDKNGRNWDFQEQSNGKPVDELKLPPVGLVVTYNLFSGILSSYLPYGRSEDTQRSHSPLNISEILDYSTRDHIKQSNGRPWMYILSQISREGTQSGVRVSH